MPDPTREYPDWRPGQDHPDLWWNGEVMRAQFRTRFIQEQIEAVVKEINWHLGEPRHGMAPWDEIVRPILRDYTAALVRDFVPPDYVGFPGLTAIELQRLLEELQNG